MDFIKMLKSEEPFLNEWYLSKYCGKDYCGELYCVKNRIGNTAEMRAIIVPGECKADEFFKKLNVVKLISADNDYFLKLYGYGIITSDGGDSIIFMISEAAENITDYLKKTRVSDGVIRDIISDIAMSIKAGNDAGICNGSIAIENIYTANGRYKAGAYGVYELFKEMNIVSGQRQKYYTAPELRDKGCSLAGDIYSLGMVAYSLYNYNRLPFVPDKKEMFSVTEEAENEAFEKRINSEYQKMKAPMYADAEAAEFIMRCIEYLPENRYQSIGEFMQAIEKFQSAANYADTINYPNFMYDKIEKKEDNPMYEENDASESLTEGRPAQFTKPADSEDSNTYTMGAQYYYSEAMSRIRNNRHVKIDESVLQDIERTERRIAEKYGENSKEYLKFIEKVKMLDDLKSSVNVLQKANKKRENIIKVLIGFAVAAALAGVILLFNTNTFYINQGQYQTIYRRNLFGVVDCFKDVSCDGLQKYGERLYYIKSDDKKIYSTSAKNGEDENLIVDTASSGMKILKGYIYYINLSDSQKLYRIATDGENQECIYDSACVNISVDSNKIKFITEENPASPKLYNPKTQEVKDELIE